MPDMRLDRLATLHLCGPISRLFSSRWKTRIPILMYHAVQEGQSDPRPYYEVNVSPATFASQMRQLRTAGYRAVSLEQAQQALNDGAADQKLVVVTFDDGYRDFYENAFPILSECQFTATVYLITGYMGDQAKPFKGKACLTWNEVRELHLRGIHFGSHTVTHPQLKDLKAEQVEEELRISKMVIEDQIGVPVRSFSYPYAFPEADHKFRRLLKDALAKNGYEDGVTTILGTANPSSDRLFLPRLPVNRWDDYQFFQAKLDGAYDWLHGFQYAAKYMHSKVL
jgi:peptidoglycan/xylan/chitin deacetylase (PgdA/CDA1 family)